jgi:hypothetical protein
MRPELESVMAKTPKLKLLDEALGALKALKQIRPRNWNDGEDLELTAAYKRVNRVLNKATKLKAA